ncbi:type II toxin-antitoxin system PemK/MazF family toxin [Mycobacterium sp. 663a-19]|uniref:type II toxin-antitoxin system PemK/MazF family toxin n=1 Tax=Mycobacterium sp. 663a-19 TaxID=2986148 RepID=UPI002D1E51C3|nr:type II toxin-antitoxin system PemK/MazF family toxin [Mycobacterium sp. 663a-19]MEB3984321.1 type II toxin-antitoxin system PemK/MazF family toxin [Mycobacterium sp. 663a-19]
MNRGELWTVSGRVYAGKPRPAIIVQDDLFSATESVVVVPLTATTVAGVAVARIAVPTTTGIAQPSYAMIDKITTVRRSNLGTRIGRVSATLMAEIERSLMVFLGLAS